MTTDHSLEVRPEGGLTKAGLDRTGAQLKLLEDFVKEMLRKDEDYGVIPGTNGKYTLLKPGAANITAAFNCHAEPLIDSQVLDPAGAFVSYEAHVDLVSNLSGQVMARGFGNCNSYEAKYRYRWEGRGGDRKRVENTNPLEQANTIKKMAIKRAEVDAAMRLPGVARFFTQDLEDMAPRGSAPATKEQDVDEALAEFDATQKPPETKRTPRSHDFNAKVKALGVAADVAQAALGKADGVPGPMTLAEFLTRHPEAEALAILEKLADAVKVLEAKP